MTVQGHEGHNGLIEEVIGKEICCLPLPFGLGLYRSENKTG